MQIQPNPIFTLLYWLLNTPGIGALIVALLGTFLVVLFASVLRWIAKGSSANESAVFTYPTEGLHDQNGGH